MTVSVSITTLTSFVIRLPSVSVEKDSRKYIITKSYKVLLRFWVHMGKGGNGWF